MDRYIYIVAKLLERKKNKQTNKNRQCRPRPEFKNKSVSKEDRANIFHYIISDMFIHVS